jgi:hypothetical protein
MRLNKLGPNKTEVIVGDRTVLFSYNTPVAYHVKGVGYFVTEKKFSVTTSKHINQWLDGAPKAIVSQEQVESAVTI